MVSLSCHTRRRDDVTLVEVLLTAESPTRVRIENRLDGPVWPPRKQGVPAEGWDEDGFEGVVDSRLVLGYATSAPPDGSPVELTATAPVDARTETDPTPEEVVRSLGDARPPRDALGNQTGSSDARADDDSRSPDEAAPPDARLNWLDAIEDRLDAADRLAAASSVPEATAAVDAVGGPEDVRTLREQLATDRQTLDRVAARCETLKERADRVEIPAETLTRLA
jgi:hypothetical protein